MLLRPVASLVAIVRRAPAWIVAALLIELARLAMVPPAPVWLVAALALAWIVAALALACVVTVLPRVLARIVIALPRLLARIVTPLRRVLARIVTALRRVVAWIVAALCRAITRLTAPLRQSLASMLGFDPFDRPTHEQLPDPFRAEVLLDGRVVGILTDRKFADMFWYTYGVEPLDPAITDDDLWDRCRFAFRDPATGRICSCAFVGGRRPFIRDDRVLIRAMYFSPVAKASRRSRNRSRSWWRRHR